MHKVSSKPRHVPGVAIILCASSLIGCIEVPLNDMPMMPPMGGKDGGSDLRPDGGPISGPIWHWESPQPQGNNLNALWGIAGATSADDILYAVGDKGTLVKGTSANWQVQQGDFPSSRAILALAGKANGTQSNMLAVGMFDLALRQASGTWTDLNPLLDTGDGSLTGVFATATMGEYFVVGTSGRIYFVHDNGMTWTREATGMTSDALFGVAGVRNSSANDIYAVGANGRVLHRSGGNWAIEADKVAPAAQQLNAVYCGDGALTGEVFAVGDGGTVLHKQKDGTWGTEAPTTSQLNAIWGLGDEVYAVGTHGEIWRRQAGSWTQEAVGVTDERLSALWGTVHDGQAVVYVVGSLGTLLRRERGIWEPISKRVTSNPLSGVWANRPGDVYAVGGDGSAGFVFRRSGSPDAGAWTAVATGLKIKPLAAVFGYANSPSAIPDVYAVGANGTVLRQSSSGSGWDFDAVGLSGVDLTAVWVGADTVWVVGLSGRIQKKIINKQQMTETWSIETGPGGNAVSQHLFAVWGTGKQVDATQVTYVGGAGGLVLRHDAQGWTQEAASLTNQTIVALFGSSENELYAFGNQGATLHRVGGQWRSEQVPSFAGGASGVAGAVVPGTSQIYAVGTQGLVLRYQNPLWLSESSLTQIPGSSVSAAAADDIFVVGANGLILHKY